MMNHDDLIVFGTHDNSRLRPMGGWGVYLFFAISGYLITTRILGDEAKVGRFRLKDFYVRRVLRIQPAALVYLAVLAILMVTAVYSGRWGAWFGAVFMYTNFLYTPLDGPRAGYLTGHFWTLAVEEHFYILLSLLLFFVRRQRVYVFGALLALIVLLQAFFHAPVSGRKTWDCINFLLFAAFMALLLKQDSIRKFFEDWVPPSVVFVGTFLAMGASLIAQFGRHHILHHFKEPEYAARTLFYSFTFWVISTCLHPRSLTTRFLELPPLRFIGRLSYSLYLWHVIFFISRSEVVGIHWHPLLTFAERPYRYIATFAVAAASYYLVEKPLIRQGHRLAPPATPGHRDLSYVGN